MTRNALLVEGSGASNVIYSPPDKMDNIGKSDKVEPLVLAGSVSSHGTSTRHGLTRDGVTVRVTGCFPSGDDVTLYAGECQPKCPESGLRTATACQVSDLQCIAPPSPPVENGIGNQFDTHDIQIVNKGKWQSEKLRRPSSIMMKNLKVKKKSWGTCQYKLPICH